MRDLIEVLDLTRASLALLGNDFSWSSWEGPEQAVGDIDRLIAELKAGRMPDRLYMRALFAVTGPIQEVSLSSGWAHDFLQLAEQFDDAERRLPN